MCVCVSLKCGCANLWERAWQSASPAVAMALFTNRIPPCAERHALMASVVALRVSRTGAGDRCCNSASHARTDIYFPKPLSYETTAETRGSFVIEKKPKKDSLWILSVRHLQLNLAPVQMRGRLDYFFFLRLSSKACGVSLVLSDWGLFFFIRATNVSTRNKFNPTVFCVRSHWWYFLRFNFRYAGAGGCNMHT